ncbi:O-antigen ligase family protein [Fortiea contorta]|uniref:O-antigen ligase family protein n=1 Tax=Fortiea contorta TaxID=1892405 RepID=UPI000345664D|nr:O-antigen ligase family protein [Fortiea contorta]
MRKFLEIAENSFVIFSLTFFSGGFGIGTTETTPGLVPENIITLIRYFIWLTATVLVCLNWKAALRTASRNTVIWTLTALVLLSFLWSEDKMLTLLDSREVLQMTSFALYFAARFSLKDQVKLVAWTFGIGAVLSAFFAVAVPTIGQHGADHPGSWKGIYDYKNTLGSMMIIGSVAFLLLPIEQPKNRLYKWLGLGLTIALILLSTSKSALVICGLIIAFIFFYRNFRWRGKISVLFSDILIMISGCVGTFIFMNWITILTGLGKDPTLTGRTILWNFIVTKIQESPWLGYGRSAFWSKESFHGAQAGALLGNTFIAPHAHNGFLDLGLDVGFIGLSLFFISLVTTFVLALKRAYATEHSEEIWPVAFLLFLVMNNMTESYLLRLANVYWVFYMTIVFSVKQRRQISHL